MAVLLATGLRFYRLGEWPPGPYRDEAYNGLDALGVLQGEHALFFPANNGREPVFIYLVAASIALLGPSTLALRLPAALVGVAATVPAFLLGRAWFGRTAGVLAALLWAVTFWPVHLGRIGLRAGLLGPLLALAFWVGTLAYRERRAGLWLAAGVVYGLTFYTYLAARFTPLLLLLMAVYLVLTGRGARLWDSGRLLLFLGGAAVTVAPLAVTLAANPTFLFGRAGQVSVFSPEISHGDPLGALADNVGRALGMYIWRGDAILRHNALLSYDAVLKADHPAGRPVFDILMALPFLAGLLWCVWNWRRPAAAALLLWQAVMLAPTILADDAPHFLRAVGVLPGTLFFPAIGLALLWDWPKLPVWLRRGLVSALVAGSLIITMRDYRTYAQQPDVGYLFEKAAADLALSARGEPPDTTVYIDQRFLEGWPSVPFLLDGRAVIGFDPVLGLPAPIDGPAAVYAWPYGPLDFLDEAVGEDAVVSVETGALARGDLEPKPYPLYARYEIKPGAVADGNVADFAGPLRLAHASAATSMPNRIEVDLTWVTDQALVDGILPSVFIHVIDETGAVIAQHDGVLADGLWPANWWRPSVAVREHHRLSLPVVFDPAIHRVEVGLYWPESGERLSVLDAAGQVVGDRTVIALP